MIAPLGQTPQELQPALEKLEAHPGSVILVAVESAEARCNFCRVTWAWLSREERKALRRPLEGCRRKREEAARRLQSSDQPSTRKCVKEGPSVGRQTDCILWRFLRPRLTFSRMSEAAAVQTNGLGSAL